jgi:mannose-6-phosphate isomerase
LTPKHIDQEELMQVLRFEPCHPEVRTAQSISPSESCFPTPADEFCLSKLTLDPERSYAAPRDRNVEILLLIEGRAMLQTSSREDRLALNRGDSVLIPAAAGSYQLSGRAAIFKATVPEHRPTR